MKRHTTAAVVNGLAILSLMIYSLDRTSWLFSVFESGRAGASLYGLLAAIVIEVAAVALIVGDATITSRWAGWGLATILATQGVANFIAGYIRGADAILVSVGPGEARSVFGIAAVALALTNFAVPFLIFVLSKLEADIIKRAMELRVNVPPSLDTPTITDGAPAQLSGPSAVADAVALPPTDVASSVVMPRSAKRQRGVAPIVRWRDDDKLSFQAIGDKLGVSRQAAQKRYARAKQS